ncbi:hypothetical protein QLH52_05580 [Methylomonas sp. OY6]|uniref:Uncharacterized protein n=1 Tax=Methylomonas defluvii TaxID=3045149 RepID=A0ABU4UBE1_9GAMM|nr:hypothetical protein [Methylomonas sp. OY6]MDX8126743.1 hypothetical protein [Methylomonas sp. OY6]
MAEYPLGINALSLFRPLEMTSEAELSLLSGAGRVLFLYGEFAGKEEYLID